MALISTDELIQSGHKYRAELLAMPLVQLKAKLAPYVTIRYGIRGKQTVGTLTNDAEIMPWRKGKNESDTSSIALRELETFMGKVVEEFDPHVLASSVYGNAINTDPTQTKLAKAVAMEMVKVASNKLFKAAFLARRDSAGTKTINLFNGWCTIIENEITAGAISTAKGNLIEVDAITSVNAYDTLRQIYKKSAEELRDQDVTLFVSHDIKDAYEEDYAIRFGSSPYNQQYQKTALQGSDNRWKIVGMSPLAGSGFAFASPKSNVLLGCDGTSDEETVEIRRPDDPALVQLFMKLFYGAEFESIDPRMLMVAKFKTV